MQASARRFRNCWQNPRRGRERCGAGPTATGNASRDAERRSTPTRMFCVISTFRLASESTCSSDYNDRAHAADVSREMPVRTGLRFPSSPRWNGSMVRNHLLMADGVRRPRRPDCRQKSRRRRASRTRQSTYRLCQPDSAPPFGEKTVRTHLLDVTVRSANIRSSGFILVDISRRSTTTSARRSAVSASTRPRCRGTPAYAGGALRPRSAETMARGTRANSGPSSGRAATAASDIGLQARGREAPTGAIAGLGGARAAPTAE